MGWCEVACWWKQWSLCSPGPGGVVRGREGKECCPCAGKQQEFLCISAASLSESHRLLGALTKIFHLVTTEQPTLYLMTFQVSSLSSLVSGETYIPFNSFMCGELWHVESWNSWRATSSYFHSKQPSQKLLLPLLRLRTVASFQGHHLRALLIIWQVFSKINYSQLRGCNYAGWRDSVNLLQLHFQAQFSTYQDVNGEERLSTVSDAKIPISWKQ